jgi:hypothetical protein
MVIAIALVILLTGESYSGGAFVGIVFAQIQLSD